MTAASAVTAQKVREDRAIYRAMKLLEGHLRKPGQPLSSPEAVRQFLVLRLAREEREVFTALWLDAQHGLISAVDLSFGTLTQTAVYPREVVRYGLLNNAASVIFAHNHPSGNALPSRADLVMTSQLMEALALVDIRVLDHFIVAGTMAVSLAERGLLGVKDFPESAASTPPRKPARKAKKTGK